jgi:putative radical SAM enzyme (TIGR03279 family)
MPLEIAVVAPDGLAAEHSLQAGDTIISINNHNIIDFLDLRFFGAEEILEIDYKNSQGQFKQAIIHQNWDIPLGIEPVPHKCRTCTNDCIFCFVDQMRPDFRETLYIKDDDYKLSFAFGNFITLTNLTERDYQKIFEQRLSPLYISVHSTNPSLHRKMLRYKQNFNIMEKLKYLSKNGIALHTQIVVVPGWNNGDELLRSLENLTSPGLNVLSVGIVPVGLTKYRNSLINLKNVSPELAKELIELSDKFPKTYCSDEIYLLADEEIPSANLYDDYPQLENGIGMIRLMLENWQSCKEAFIKEIAATNSSFVFVTGKLAFIYISKIAEEINEILPGKISTISVDNIFFGPSVTVTGLLAGEDILSQINTSQNRTVVLSSNIFNENGLTLDNMSKTQLKDKLDNKLLIVNEDFSFWNHI